MNRRANCVGNDTDGYNWEDGKYQGDGWGDPIGSGNQGWGAPQDNCVFIAVTSVHAYTQRDYEDWNIRR